VVGFTSISSWTLFGAAFRIHLNQPRVKQGLNILLSLLLAYTALEISGLFDLIF
jgi:threonine/homoserine/homoserine lactone efflux protein